MCVCECEWRWASKRGRVHLSIGSPERFEFEKIYDAAFRPYLLSVSANTLFTSACWPRRRGGVHTSSVIYLPVARPWGRAEHLAGMAAEWQIETERGRELKVKTSYYSSIDKLSFVEPSLY